MTSGPIDTPSASASGLPTPGPHRPIMAQEVLACLRPSAGETAVDCTLGGGGHAEAMLARLQPGGRLLGLDVDALELPRTEARLRAAGYGADTFAARHATFAALPEVLASEGVRAADVVLVDLGVSTMQVESAVRGFSYKVPGPLDMRLDPTIGEPASALLATCQVDTLAALLVEHADEPHASIIAELLVQARPTTTHAAERTIRLGLSRARPDLPAAEIKRSVRRTFQALRIAVNAEFAALDALLAALPGCLAPGGRVAILTFHSGEDRRVKKAFQAGRRAGVYAEISGVVRSAKAETFANRRAAAAKLRWAVRAGTE